MNPRLGQFKKTVMFLMKSSLTVSASGLFVLFFKAFYETPALMFKDNYVLGGVYLLVLLLLSFSYGCFKIGTLRLRELAYSYLLALTLTNLTSWAQLSLTYHRFVSISPMILLTLIQSGAAVVLYLWANRAYFSLSAPRDAIAIVVDREEDRKLLEKFRHEPQRYSIAAVAEEKAGLEALKAAAAPWPQVVLCRCGPQTREALTLWCFEEGKRLYSLPTVQELLLHEAGLCQIGDSLVLLSRNRPMTREQKLVKRAMDIALSGTALILLSPLIALVSLAIKAQDRGPILYRQTRLTRGGREFQLLKFRSMVTDAEKDGIQTAVKDDVRITPLGRWLRKTRLDELPQLINILRGDMSIVGPRPERPEIAEATCREFPQFRYRLKVQAGLTGYAQVYGRYDTPLEDKVKMDLLYIQRFSIATDLFLMVATLKVLFMASKAEGKKTRAGEARSEAQKKTEQRRGTTS